MPRLIIGLSIPTDTLFQLTIILLILQFLKARYPDFRTIIHLDLDGGT